ncbi:MAG: hypothetical protein ILP18_06535 [Treponema sp.]|nr:hypothetical protein [Treponema sp.]
MTSPLLSRHLGSLHAKNTAMTLIRIADALHVSPRDFFPVPEGSSGGVDVKSEIKKEIRELLERL